MKERKQREEKGNGKKNKAGYTADGWAGAVMRKLHAIQKCDLPTDTASSRVASPGLKTEDKGILKNGKWSSL